MLKRIKNFFLCLKYPFLRMRNVWTGKPAGYRSTWLDALPDGWRKAFGKQFCRDLRKALIEDKQLHEFRFSDVKEKYGTLRLYHFGAGRNTNYVLNKYMYLSTCYCAYCGKHARYITDGWIEHLCEDCGKKLIKPKYLDECRLTKNDIPISVTHYPDGHEERVEVAKQYNIDFETLWGLINE